MDKNEILDQQMVEKRKHYKAESYGMSIGEFANMYVSEEVIINPVHYPQLKANQNEASKTEAEKQRLLTGH